MHISWEHLTALYGKSCFSSGLRKKEHLHLDYYSRMRVNLAARVSWVCMLIVLYTSQRY